MTIGAFSATSRTVSPSGTIASAARCATGVSKIDEIPGVGPRTRQRLLEHFGSIRALRNASPDALTAVVNPSVAAKIRKHFEAEPTTESTLRVLN